MDPAFECTVCTDLFLDPVTAPCGHSFCRRCLARSLDHRPECPLCRAQVFGVFAHDAKVSVTIQEIIERQVPENVRVARAARAEVSTLGPEGTAPMSMFVMLPVLPQKGARMKLMIYEPRYRLMIRRAMETSRRFGMMAPESDCATEVELARVDPLPDGRFNITIRPTGRRVRVVSRHFDESGYEIGHVRDVTDVTDDVAAAYMRRAEGMIEQGTANGPYRGRSRMLRHVREETSGGESQAEAGAADARWFAEHVCELDKVTPFAVTRSTWSLQHVIFYVADARGADYDPATDDREHLKGFPEFQEGGSGRIPIADVSLEVVMHEFHACMKRAVEFFDQRFTGEAGARARSNKKTLEEAIEPRRWDDPDAVSWSLTCAEEFSWRIYNVVAGLTFLLTEFRRHHMSAWLSELLQVAVGSQSVRERLVLCRALLLLHLQNNAVHKSNVDDHHDTDEDEEEDENEEEDEDEDENEDEDEDEDENEDENEDEEEEEDENEDEDVEEDEDEDEVEEEDDERLSFERVRGEFRSVVERWAE